MKKTITILACLFLTGIGFYGCKKGPNDPFISIWSRKHRLTGDWTISSGTQSSTSGGSITTTTWSGSTVTRTAGGSSMIGTGSMKLSIVKDGTYTFTQNITWTTTPSFISNYTETGTWNWTGRVGALKNKEQIVLSCLSSTTLNGSSSTVDTYTGADAPVTLYNIDELKNKTLVLKNDGTSVSGGTITTDSNTMTFTQ
ncbi:MAG TPA: hypothetical protein VII99_08000 [Bacteroidia bacterium]